jgi:hypothetical protein
MVGRVGLRSRVTHGSQRGSPHLQRQYLIIDVGQAVSMVRAFGAAPWRNAICEWLGQVRAALF